MKTCPKCNGKYFDSDTNCSECGITLIDNAEYNKIVSELQEMTYEERKKHQYEQRYRTVYKYYYNGSTSNDTCVTDKSTSSNSNSCNIPKCPTCGSTNVNKISATKKALGFITVGVFSSNLGKTMECKNCGYKW